MNKIYGKIIDKLAKTPIYEAVILLNKINSSSIDIAQLSNENGVFKWLELEPGQYTLQINAADYKSQTLHFKCDINSNINLLISLIKC